MNKNIIIGSLVVVIVVIGAFVLVNSYQPAQNTGTATSTTPGTTPGPNPSPTPVAQAGVPIVVTDANTVVSNSTVVVTGKVTPNGAQASYWYDYGKTTAFGGRTASQVIGSGFAAISAPSYITGLNANTLYYYRLSAQNSFGTVNGPMQSFTTNNNPPPQAIAPGARTDAGTGISRTTANLNGHVNPGGSDASYWFEYGTTANLGNVTNFQAVGNGNVSVPVSISVSGLQPLTKYYFRVNAQNQYGTVNGAILNFTTQGPPAPSAPSATTNHASKIGTSTVTLNGQVNPNGDPTTYWFEYSVDSLLGTILGNTTHQQLAGSGTATAAVLADVNGLGRNIKYFYRLVAVNSYGTTRGDIVTFRTNQ